MRLLVTYGKSGRCIPDLTVGSWAEGVVSDYRRYKKHSSEEDYGVYVGTEAMVTALRVLALRGEIPYNELVFVFDDKEITINGDARLSSWPDGFCDTQDKMLTELLGWGVPSAKKVE